MILKKRLYRERTRLVSLIKLILSLFLLFLGLFRRKRDIFLEEDERQNRVGRPKLLSRSKVVVGDWGACESICPTKCLKVEISGGKLKTMTLDIFRCIGCGYCIDKSPESSLAFEKIEMIKDIDCSLAGMEMDLISERDAENTA